MSIRGRLIRTQAMFVLLATLLGCGQPDFYQCEGVVTHEGKPIPGLQLDFMPENPDLGRPPYAITDESGRFELTTGRDNGLIPGKYSVSVQDPGAADGRKTSTAPEYLYVIDRYSSAKSDLKYEANKHEPNLELKLDKKDYTGPPVQKAAPIKNTTG